MLRRAILPGMALLVILGTCATSVPAAAEQTLTITLDSTASQKDDMRLKHETAGATRENASKQVTTTQQYRAETQTKTSGKEAPIGRVGGHQVEAQLSGRNLLLLPEGHLPCYRRRKRRLVRRPDVR